MGKIVPFFPLKNKGASHFLLYHLNFARLTDFPSVQIKNLAIIPRLTTLEIKVINLL